MARYDRFNHLTANTLDVGTLTINGEAYEAPAKAEPKPAAPHPGPLPEKATAAILKERVDLLTAILIEHGLITRPDGE